MKNKKNQDYAVTKLVLIAAIIELMVKIIDLIINIIKLVIGN